MTSQFRPALDPSSIMPTIHPKPPWQAGRLSHPNKVDIPMAISGCPKTKNSASKHRVCNQGSTNFLSLVIGQGKVFLNLILGNFQNLDNMVHNFEISKSWKVVNPPRRSVIGSAKQNANNPFSPLIGSLIWDCKIGLSSPDPHCLGIFSLPAR